MKFKNRALAAVLAFLLTAGAPVVCRADETEPTPSSPEDLVRVMLPTVNMGGESMLDFILDPQGLIGASGAARYGGVPFEDGATLFFYNAEGAYALSSRSDRLTITSSGDAPVEVTVVARLGNLNGLTVSPDPAFGWGGEIYLALTDNEGTIVPFDWDGTARLCTILPPSEVEVEYAFGLTGACNPDGDWEDASDAHPVLTVTWSVEPILSELYQTEEIEEDAEEAETELAAIEEEPEEPSDEPVETLEDEPPVMEDTENGSDEAPTGEDAEPETEKAEEYISEPVSDETLQTAPETDEIPPVEAVSKDEESGIDGTPDAESGIDGTPDAESGMDGTPDAESGMDGTPDAESSSGEDDPQADI